MYGKERLLAQLQEYYNQVERLRNRQNRGTKPRRKLNEILKNISDSIEVIEIMEM